MHSKQQGASQQFHWPTWASLLRWVSSSKWHTQWNTLVRSPRTLDRSNCCQPHRSKAHYSSPSIWSSWGYPIEKRYDNVLEKIKSKHTERTARTKIIPIIPWLPSIEIKKVVRRELETGNNITGFRFIMETSCMQELLSCFGNMWNAFMNSFCNIITLVIEDV